MSAEKIFVDRIDRESAALVEGQLRDSGVARSHFQDGTSCVAGRLYGMPDQALPDPAALAQDSSTARLTSSIVKGACVAVPIRL